MTYIETEVTRALTRRARGAEAFEPDLVAVERRARRLRRRSRSRVTVVVLVAGAALISVTLVTVRSNGSGRQVISAEAHGGSLSFAPPEVPDGALPRVSIPGWTTVSASEHEATWGDYLAVLRDPDRPVAAPVVRVMVTRAPIFYGGGRDPRQVEVDGHAATLSTGTTGRTAIWWYPAPDTELVVSATGLDEPTLLRVARGLVVEPDLTAATPTFVPDGLVPMNLRDDGPPLGAEYVFARNGAAISINLYPGGWRSFEDRISDAESDVSPIDVDRGVGLFEDEGDTFRLWWLDGWWTWEIKGPAFQTRQELLDVLNSLQVQP